MDFETEKAVVGRILGASLDGTLDRIAELDRNTFGFSTRKLGPHFVLRHFMCSSSEPMNWVKFNPEAEK